MSRVSARYKFGSESSDKFRYCGREIVKDKNGITVACPGLAERVKPIYLTAQQRQQRDQQVTEEVRGQLRSVVGLTFPTRSTGFNRQCLQLPMETSSSPTAL